MAIPGRFTRLFEPELEPGETIRSVANADLWLRYRRLALTNRRVLAVERGALRNPFGKRKVTSIPLAAIAGVEVRPGRLITHLTLRTDFSVLDFAMPSFARGTMRFARAVEQAIHRTSSV